MQLEIQDKRLNTENIKRNKDICDRYCIVKAFKHLKPYLFKKNNKIAIDKM